jgi:hypothetical protein
MDLHLFQSKTNALVQAFTDRRSSDPLPADLAPWDYVGTTLDHQEWTHPADKSSVIAGVEINGFFLWDEEGTDEAGSRPLRPHER